MGKRAGRARTDEDTPEVAKAKDEGRQRTIYQVGNSWVVPVPIWARRILERAEGGHVYWFEHRPGEVVLAMTPARKGGRTSGEASQRKLAKVIRENTRLRRRLRQWPLAQLAQADSIGAMKGIRATLPDAATFDEMLRLLREIYARMPLSRGPRRAARSAQAQRQVEPAPAPVLEAPPKEAGPTLDT